MLPLIEAETIGIPHVIIDWNYIMLINAIYVAAIGKQWDITDRQYFAYFLMQDHLGKQTLIAILLPLVGEEVAQ